ncbi:MAG: hypothetical protein KA116_12270 [Proteobacteria bacterium]|nr:hypothetical protein [Pseudomonadota bacterium]
MEIVKSKKSLSNFKFAQIVAALIFISSAQIKASGFDEVCFDMECNSFFAPEIIERSSEFPFFRSYHTFYSHAPDGEKDRFEEINTINTKEWSNYLGNVLSYESLSQLLYKVSLEDLTKLRNAIQGKPTELSDELKAIKASLDTLNKKNQVVVALKYLDLAKRVEPLTTRMLGKDGWEETPVEGSDPQKDLEDANKLINEAIPLAQNNKDTFLKNRYQLQVIRLYYYSKQYSKAQSYYKQNLSSIKVGSSVKYRFMDMAAGSLYKDKKYGPANYIYSLIYDQFAPMKRTSYFSFHPMEESDWQETLAMAKTKREKEILWQLLGVYADGLSAIKHIYAINPTSNLLPLLLVREVNKAEEEWTTNQERIKNPKDFPDGVKTDLETVGVQRLETIKVLTDAGKVYKPYLWQISLAHLYTLTGNLKEASKYISLAKANAPASPIVQAQIRMSSFFTKMRSMSAVDKSLEDHLANELSWLASYKSDENFRADTLYTWTRNRLSDFYESAGDHIRSLMLVDRTDDTLYRNNSKIDELITFVNNSANSKFDSFLSKVAYVYTLEDLTELKALNLMYAGKAQESADLLKQSGVEIANQELNADPFMIHIWDCHDCDFEAPHDKYTKLSFVNRMAELQKKAEALSGQEAADVNFQLANGFYNMSWYGNSRVFYDTKYGNLRKGYDDKDPKADQIMNMIMSQKYYQKALDLSQDREFKTKMVYMLAKTERNDFYTGNPVDWENPPKSDIPVGKYFKVLKDNYSDTEYFKEILNECGYFKTYMQK